MPANRHLPRATALAVFTLALGAAPFAAGDTQDTALQKLFERGAYNEVVERVGGTDDPAATYLAAQALLKLENGGGANERFQQLRDHSDEAWKAIGEAGAALVDGNSGTAMAAARRAIEADDNNPYAHYQLGLVASRQGNFQRAAEAFEKSTDLKSDFAYAHYYAGMAYQRIKNVARMTEHLTQFIRLAPDAPERQTVQSILKSLRG